MKKYAPELNLYVLHSDWISKIIHEDIILVSPFQLKFDF